MSAMKSINTKVLIIGGGLAGWTAAWECAHAGLETCLLQDGGGASSWVHGFNAPIHPEDSIDIFLQDTLRSGQGLCDSELAHTLCYDAIDTFEWIRSMGLPFNRENQGYQLLRPLGASYPRVVSVGNETGAAVLKMLRSELSEKVLEKSNTRAVRLRTDEGRVTGAIAYSHRDGQWLQINSGAIVMATGGYCGIYPVSTNKRDSGGDGIAMAYEAGAEMCDMEFIQFEPSTAVWPEKLIGLSVITTLLYEGAVLRNKEGDRFMMRYGDAGECVGKDAMTKQIAAEIANGHGTEHGGVYFDVTGVDRERLTRDYAMYVERYRAVGINLLSEWIEIAPAPHTSLGGVVISEDGCTTIEGLFGCGEIIGGLHGANRMGGNAGLETMVFGRRAGKSAASYAAAVVSNGEMFTDDFVYSDTSCADRLDQMRREMQDVLWQGVNVLREEASLSSAVQLLSDSLEELRMMKGRNSQEEFACRRLQNDVTAALLTARSALERKDTLGCHMRSDYPERNEQTYRLTMNNNSTGGVKVRKENLKH